VLRLEEWRLTNKSSASLDNDDEGEKSEKLSQSETLCGDERRAGWNNSTEIVARWDGEGDEKRTK
jgi:hypothetical protein